MYTKTIKPFFAIETIDKREGDDVLIQPYLGRSIQYPLPIMCPPPKYFECYKRVFYDREEANRYLQDKFDRYYEPQRFALRHFEQKLRKNAARQRRRNR